MAGSIIANIGCQQPGGNTTGSEFIPDMAHSVAYEANVLNNYSLNTWDKESTFTRRQLSQPKLPVKNTIPRGYAAIGIGETAFVSPEEAVESSEGKMYPDGGIAYTPDGHVPYYFPDTEEGRTLAMQQIKYNPFPITAEGLAKGQELYNIFCGICHGDAGGGNGYLVRDNGGKYPAQPANLLDSQYVYSSNGRYYHAIIYGKNAMGGYSDKLSYEERWDVIHYIRSLQAKAKKLKYDATENSLAADFGFPAAKMTKTTHQNQAPVGEMPPSEPGQSDAVSPEKENPENHGGSGH